jgi:hypothetical protein
MINRNEIEFLELWKFYIDLAIAQYGQDPKTFSTFDRTATFWSIDQDTFNMAAMSCESAISEMGPEGMDFIHGGWTMSHATGSSKPWRKNYFKSFINGNPPSTADKEFWSNMVTGIIHPASSGKIKVKLNSVKIYSLLGRFYRRY